MWGQVQDQSAPYPFLLLFVFFVLFHVFFFLLPILLPDSFITSEGLTRSFTLLLFPLGVLVPWRVERYLLLRDSRGLDFGSHPSYHDFLLFETFPQSLPITSRKIGEDVMHIFANKFFITLKGLVQVYVLFPRKILIYMMLSITK